MEVTPPPPVWLPRRPPVGAGMPATTKPTTAQGNDSVPPTETTFELIRKAPKEDWVTVHAQRATEQEGVGHLISRQPQDSGKTSGRT
jgi:hypothetical protein